MKLFAHLQQAARRIKHDAMTVYFVARDRQTPWHVRGLALAIAAYALSPIDLIPDFIPVLGYLDDVILLPLLIWLALRLLPPEVIAESRRQAEAWLQRREARPRSWAGAIGVGLVWLALAVLLSLWGARALGG